jgi:hypothetical protein
MWVAGFAYSHVSFASLQLFPLWDDLNCINGGVFAGVNGTAPFRQVVLEWRGYSYANITATFKFQVSVKSKTATRNEWK